MKNTLASLLLLLQLSVPSSGQTESAITVGWPSAEKPSLRLTFGKFQQSGLVNGQGIFTCDVVAQNVLDQAMSRSVFTVLISDKGGLRIGRARLQLPEIRPYQTEKTQIQFSAAGIPAGVALLAGKTIPLKVISVPPGANLKIDGEDAGVTPKLVDFTIGSHTLEFSKEGYATGSTALDVAADELPGGSVSFELGGLSKDTVELRDGTVLLGDVISMSMTTVTVRVDGKDQKYDRNQVKRVLLVERIVETHPAVPPSPEAKPHS
jgi:PEGA domain-containing protein